MCAHHVAPPHYEIKSHTSICKQDILITTFIRTSNGKIQKQTCSDIIYADFPISLS